MGREVCRRLLDDGAEVTAVVRAPASYLELRDRACVVHSPDLTDLARNAKLLGRLDAIVHLAAHVHQPRQSRVATDRFREVNVEGTRAVAVAAAEAGVRRFVYISSVKATAERTFGDPVAESDLARPEDAYGRSKREAELVLETIAAATGMEVVIGRPPLVYGRGAKGNVRQLVSWLRRGIPLPLGAIENRRSLIAVENLADFCSRALGKVPSRYSLYHVADDRAISTPQIIQLIASGLDREARLLRVPPAAVRLGLRVLGRRDLIDRLTGSLELDTRRVALELGWRPPTAIEVAMPRSVREAGP
ncbi:MAG: NAD-dependent epimerase/dehydratase family protein [Proteobacteria bacterium]|nr:NAD-dependent epimerase/dehydratase family protein [Pseudomonadota bacterium]